MLMETAAASTQVLRFKDDKLSREPGPFLVLALNVQSLEKLISP